MNLIQNYLTESGCYKAGKHITVKGLMIHSVGCPHLWSKFGLTMAQFRKDIKAAMEGSTTEDSLTAIMGKAAATAEQMKAYLKKKNPAVPQSVLDMIPLYISES